MGPFELQSPFIIKSCDKHFLLVINGGGLKGKWGGGNPL